MNGAMQTISPVAREWKSLIAAHRKPAGYATQAEFAEAVGVTQGTVSMWERGIVAPRVSHWPTICALLGIADNEMERVYRAQFKRAA